VSQLSSKVEEMATGNIGRLLFKYSWPALVAMSLNALYSVVDRFYIGRGCGEEAMAGLTLTFPVMMLFGAVGVFIGLGHAALLSIKLGEGERRQCEKILGELVFLKIVAFLILPGLIFFNVDTVINLCGGSKVSARAFASAATYLKLVMFSHLFSHLAFGLSAAMRSEGAAVKSMMAMVVGFGLNLILDPIFIFGFGMGVAGAAWATNIAMFSSCMFALSHYLSGKSEVRLKLRSVGFYPTIAWRTFGIGFAPFLQQLLGALINLLLAAAFVKWSSDKASATAQIASLGVFQTALILILMPIMGAQQGLQPIIGYNWGARNFARVREALFKGLKLTTCFCVGAFVLQVVPPFPRLLASMFIPGSNPELLAKATWDLQVSNCMIWCISLNIVATTYFQSIGHPLTAIVLSTLRQGACMMPVIWFLPYFMEHKTLAIWLSMPISDVACFLMTLLPFWFHTRFLRKVRDHRKISEKRGV
jgi:putative MATE family efflux protein